MIAAAALIVTPAAAAAGGHPRAAGARLGIETAAAAGLLTGRHPSAAAVLALAFAAGTRQEHMQTAGLELAVTGTPRPARARAAGSTVTGTHHTHHGGSR